MRGAGAGDQLGEIITQGPEEKNMVTGKQEYSKALT